jgi:proline iminopeptidase
METRVATPDGAELYVRTIGSGAPVIVPLACWCQEYETLAGNNQVVLYDPRGRGRSSPLVCGCVSFEADVRDLECVREHLDLDMFALVGWGYYGGVAARYAMLYPEYVARMALVASTPVRGGSLFRAVQEEENARLQCSAPELMREMASGAPYTSERMRAFWDALVRTRTAAPPRRFPFHLENERPENALTLVAAAMRSRGDWDWSADARAIDAPVLAIGGAADVLQDVVCREWVKALPNARAIVMEGVGHFPWLEAPNRYFEILHQFLLGDWPV